MQRVWVAIAVALATPAWAADKPEMAPPGAWVEPFPAAKGKAPAPPAGEDVPLQVLRLDQQVRFGKDQDERYVETAIKLLTPQGLAAMGTISLPWQPDFSTLIIHKLHIIRGAETIDVLADGREFTVLRREEKLESAILDGVLTAAIQPEGLQVGDIIELAFTVRHRDPVLADHSEFLVSAPFAPPGMRVHVAAQWPADRTIQWRKTAPMPAPKVWKDKDGNHLTATLDDLSTLTLPKNAPARFAPARQIEFSSYAGWADISAAMAPLYEKAAAIPAGSPLLAEIEKIRATSPDPKQRATAALRLVQDRIRYVYQGMNSGNLMPAAAGDTWTRRFGDCKGKTALLLAILRALDIKAEPAAVSTVNGDGLDARLPLVGLLDHILIRAEIDGKSYWLDGTRLGDGDIDGIAVPPFRWALPVRAAGSGFVPLVQSPFDKPAMQTDVAIDASLGIYLPAPIEVTTIFRGDGAVQMNLQLAALTGKDRDTGLKAYWKDRYSFLTPEQVSTSFDAKAREYVMKVSGTAELKWTAYGYEVDHAGLGWKADYKRDEGQSIDPPVEVTFPYYQAYKETIVLPREGRGFTVEGEDVDTKAAGYAFSRKTRIADGTLVMEASTRALQPEIPYADALAASAAIDAIDKVRVFARTPRDYQRTAAEQKRLFDTEPTTADGYVDRGNGLLNSGELDKAIADFDKAIALDANSAIAFADRGIAYAWKKQSDKALADFDKAAAINPRMPEVFNGRAIVLGEQGDFGGAIAALGRAIDLKEDNRWALHRRAGLYVVQGDDAKALGDLATLLKTNPADMQALAMRQDIEARTGRYEAALATLDEMAKTPAAPGTFDVTRAYVLARMGKADQARALFAAQRQKAGKDKMALNNLCWTQGQADFDLDTALADCEASLKIDPEAPPTLDSSGMVLLRMGRFDDAIKRYDRALAKAPGMPASLYGRGIARLRKGEAEAGQADLAAATKAEPGIAVYFGGFGVKP